MQSGPTVLGGLDVDHEERHQQEEQGGDEADTVDGHVADGGAAVQLVTAEWHLRPHSVDDGNPTDFGIKIVPITELAQSDGRGG